MTTRDVYNKFATQYHSKRTDADRSLWNDQLDFPMISALLGSELKGKRIADLGCGSGLFSARFAHMGAAVHGVDISEKLIEIARKNAPAANFSVGDVTHTGLAAESFDLVTSCLVAHYLRDLEPFFREAARLLAKPRGKFIFSFHHPVNEVMKREGEKVFLRPYFHGDAYKWTMLDGMELESFHHTFEDIFASLYRSGFVVEELKEAKPDRRLAEKHPEFYQFTSSYPTFASIRAALR